MVFSNATLHWIKDHVNLLQRVFRALRPGGVLRFSFAADGNCPTFNRVVQEVMAGSPFACFFRAFEWPWYIAKIDDYRALARQFALRELKVWGERADRFFPDSDAMIRWIDQPSLLPFLPWVVAAQRDGFRAEVIARMIRETQREDGRCFETFRRIHVLAAK